MSYQFVYNSIVPYHLQNGNPTAEEILQKEKEIPHKLYTVEQLNQMTEEKGREAPALKDKFTPEEKAERRARYEKLHEKMIRNAASKRIESEKTKPILKEHQRQAGVKEQHLEESSGNRYPEELMLDLSGTEEGMKYNIELSETFIFARKAGLTLKEGEKNPYKDKFNEYHRKLFDKVDKYPLEEIAKNAGDDDYLVDHFEQIEDGKALFLQFQNIRNAYKKAKIPLPQDIQNSMKRMEPILAELETMEMRLSTIDTPYYEELDFGDPATYEFLKDEGTNEALSKCEDTKHPADLNRRDLAMMSTSAVSFEEFYQNNQEACAKEIAGEMGIAPENMMVRIGNTTQPLMNGGFLAINAGHMQDLLSGRIDGITIYDRKDPVRSVEIPASREKDFSMARALGKIRKNPLPAPVAKPHWFKRAVYSVFGGYKQEVEPYNTYKAELAERCRELGIQPLTGSERRARQMQIRQQNEAKTAEQNRVEPAAEVPAAEQKPAVSSSLVQAPAEQPRQKEISPEKAKMMEKANQAVDILRAKGLAADEFKDSYWKESGADKRAAGKLPNRMDKLVYSGKKFYADAISIANQIRNGDMDPQQPISPLCLYRLVGNEVLREFYRAGDHTLEEHMETGLGSRGVTEALHQVPELKERFDNMTAEKFVTAVTDPDFMKFGDDVKEKIKGAAVDVKEKLIREKKAAPTRDEVVKTSAQRGQDANQSQKEQNTIAKK